MGKSHRGQFEAEPHDVFEKGLLVRLHENGRVGPDDYNALGFKVDKSLKSLRAQTQTLRRRLAHLAFVNNALLSEDGLTVTLTGTKRVEEQVATIFRHHMEIFGVRPSLPLAAEKLGLPEDDPPLKTVYPKVYNSLGPGRNENPTLLGKRSIGEC